MNGISFNPDTWDILGTAQGIGANPTFDQPRTSATVPSNATQSMQPVTATDDPWSDFWRGTAQALVGYGIARDAAKRGVTVPGGDTPMVERAIVPSQGAARSQLVTGLVLAAVAAGAIFLVVKAAAK